MPSAVHQYNGEPSGPNPPPTVRVDGPHLLPNPIRLTPTERVLLREIIDLMATTEIADWPAWTDSYTLESDAPPDPADAAWWVEHSPTRDSGYEVVS